MTGGTRSEIGGWGVSEERQGEIRDSYPRVSNPPRGSPRDLTQRPGSDVVPEPSLYVLSPPLPQNPIQKRPHICRTLLGVFLHGHVSHILVDDQL